MTFETLTAIIEKTKKAKLRDVISVVGDLYRQTEAEDDSIDCYYKLYDLFDLVLQQPLLEGTESDFHNLTVTCARQDDYNTACRFLDKGLVQYPYSIDLLSDYLSYGMSCGRNEQCLTTYSRLLERRSVWNWRAYHFAISYLIEAASIDSSICPKDIWVLIREFQEKLPTCEESYIDEAEFLDTFSEHIEEKVNSFVAQLMNGYVPNNYEHTKVIHDPVWGTMMFYPWELQIIDSPLLQRLRKISQVGLAVLTYPSAHHSRFEHTLGVMSVVTKMVNNINQEQPKGKYADENKVITNEDLFKMRFAALMHDVGHCFFSHLSESIYGKLTPFVELKDSFEIFSGAKEHEIFAYIIVNCSNFKDFFKKFVKYPYSIDEDFFSDIGRMIVGAFIEPDLSDIDVAVPVKKYYLTQIINGQFDADKLDYLRRDSHTAGLALTYDIERFLYKIRIVDQTETVEGKTIIGKHLTIPMTGVSAVEEMAFSQLMLASYIYQHQKVLATDALIQDVAEGLTKNEKLKHPCDFLHYCDDDIYYIYDNHIDSDFKQAISQKAVNAASAKTLSDIVKRVRMRDLPKRALAINFNTVAELHSQEKTKYRVADIADSLRSIKTLRQEICNEAQNISNLLPEADGGNKVIDIYDIHLSIPKTSIAKDLNNAFVVTSDNQIVPLSEIVRLSDWADAFSYHKWNAYVFSRADIVPIVSIASKVVFERHGLKFDDARVFKGFKEEKLIVSMWDKLTRKYGYKA